MYIVKTLSLFYWTTVSNEVGINTFTATPFQGTMPDFRRRELF